MSTKEIKKQIDFLNKFGSYEVNLDSVYNHTDKYKYILGYTSGGSISHLFIQLHDNRIISLHLTMVQAEISFSKYDSISDYVNSDEDEKGFGYENFEPDYENRSRPFENWEELLPI